MAPFSVQVYVCVPGDRCVCPAERHCVCLASLYRTRQGVQGRPSALLGPPQTKSVRGARWGLPSSSDNGDVPVSTFSQAAEPTGATISSWQSTHVTTHAASAASLPSSLVKGGGEGEAVGRSWELRLPVLPRVTSDNPGDNSPY